MDESSLSDVLGLAAGAGMVLVQAAAVIPGLLPALLLVLPVALLGLAAGVLVGVVMALAVAARLLLGGVVRLIGLARLPNLGLEK
jgi:hypothetical protein